MSSLNSLSTDAQVQAAYDDNASYAEDASASKCKAFITAVRILLRRIPKQAGSREGNMILSPELLQKELEEARQWIAVNDTAADGGAGGPNVSRASFENFR